MDGALLQAGADGRIRGREIDVVQCGADVQPGASHQDRHPAAFPDRGDHRARLPLVRGDARLVGDVQDVEQMMRDTALLLLRHLRGADVHPAVQLQRIGVDDLAVEPFGERDREVGLAGGGGTDDRDQRCVGKLSAVPVRAAGESMHALYRRNRTRVSGITTL